MFAIYQLVLMLSVAPCIINDGDSNIVQTVTCCVISSLSASIILNSSVEHLRTSLSNMHTGWSIFSTMAAVITL